MFVVVGKCGYGVKVLDTDDGVVENVSFSKLRDILLSGVHIYGVKILPEFGDGCDMFLDFEASRGALKSVGIQPETFNL